LSGNVYVFIAVGVPESQNELGSRICLHPAHMLAW
jgi:hypothetical protein